MSGNGKQSPRRPRIEVSQSSASPEEAAAIAAALEQFLRDTAPAPGGVAEARANAWLRAGRLESTGHDPQRAGPWGDGDPWGS